MSKHPPPLNALKAFEAAGRNSSFVLASTELGVTSAAVSQLVRKLEDHLGKKLFQRFNNRIALTDAGKSPFAATSPAIAELTEAISRVSRSTARRKLRVSVLSSLAECWLLHVLPRFLQHHPRIRIDLSIEESASNNTFDLRLCYGRQPDDDLVQDELWRDEVMPYCSPNFLRRTGGNIEFTASLSDQMIHTQWGSSFASNATWRDWYHAYAPTERVDMGGGHDVNTSRAALQLAEHGVGIALGQRLLAREALARGALVEASRQSLPLGQSYVIAIPTARSRLPDVQAFRTWLLSEVREPLGAPPQHRLSTPTH